MTSQCQSGSISVYGSALQHRSTTMLFAGKGTKYSLTIAIAPASSEPLSATTPTSSLASSSTSRARKDLPVVHNYTRGSKRKALDAAADDDQMAHAMASYIQDWRSAGDASDDYWSTWSQLHRAHWDGVRREVADVLPLDPLRVHIIGALLKIGGYRSSSNDIDVARTKHIELGYYWGTRS